MTRLTPLFRAELARRLRTVSEELLHRFDDGSGCDHRRQVAELDQVATCRAAATVLADNYTGLPFQLPGEQF